MQAINNAATKPTPSVTVLDKFRPFARLIQAYDRRHFRHTNRRELLRSVFYAICATSIVVFTPMLICLAIRCLLQNDPSIEKLAVAIPLLLSLAQTSSTFVVMVRQNGDISAAIEHLQRSVNHRLAESKQSQPIYDRVEAKHAFLTTFVVKVLVAMQIVVFVASGTVPVCYAIFGFPSPKLWMLPVQTRVPDGPDYVAFYGAYLFQLITMLGNLMCVCAPASIYVGMFFYINGMTEDIKANLKCANEIRPEEVTTQTDTFWQAYVHAMKFHTKIIRAAQSLAWMETVLFVSTIVCTVVLAFNLYVLELAESVNVEIIVAFLDTLMIVGLTFGYFCLSEMITTDLLSIGDFFYDSPWYRLPAKRQRLLALPIQRAQCEFRLQGMGIVDASLSVFASIINSAGSYFLMIRQFK